MRQVIVIMRDGTVVEGIMTALMADRIEVLPPAPPGTDARHHPIIDCEFDKTLSITFHP